jgi:hypothetical protein
MLNESETQSHKAAHYTKYSFAFLQVCILKKSGYTDGFGIGMKPMLFNLNSSSKSG